MSMQSIGIKQKGAVLGVSTVAATSARLWVLAAFLLGVLTTFIAVVVVAYSRKKAQK